MGIDVINAGEVIFNSNHDNLVVTCPSKNPTIAFIKEMRVQSIFRRVKAKTRSGDGNPLIYALKRTKGFSICSKELVKFLPDFQEIIVKALQDNQFDIIIPMPSSYPVSTVLAKRIFRTTGQGKIMKNLLRKKMNGEVLAELHLTEFPSKFKSLAHSLRKKLEKSEASGLFSMKSVKTDLRPFIQPLVLSCDPAISPERILLVDDLVSSGATLVSARDSLEVVFPRCQIEALTLLSKVRKK